MKTGFIRTAVIGAAALALALGTAACSSSSDSGGSAAAELNCEAAAQGVRDYAAALDEIASGSDGGDPAAVTAATERLKAATDAIRTNLPGLPASAGAFLEGSQTLADALAAAGDDPDALLAALESVFGNEEFAAGGEAIDTFFKEKCPGISLE